MSAVHNVPHIAALAAAASRVLVLCCAAALPVIATAADSPAKKTTQQTQKAALSGDPTAQPSARQDAAFNLEGTWAAIVNEDWRWRMVTPPKGDYASVPLNDLGKQVADTWTTAQDGSCKAYGVGGLMRLPLRVRFSWEGDSALKIETDRGKQVRRLLFGAPGAAPEPARSLQGTSRAEWIRPAMSRQTLRADGKKAFEVDRTPNVGSLKVVTTGVSGGWLRRNGVPYSEDAVVTEYFDRFVVDGNDWFVVTTIVSDPKYLTEKFVTSSHFRRDPDTTKWHPQDCAP
jgi:hypothetical protein